MSIVIEQRQQPAAGSQQPGNLASELVERGQIGRAEKLYRDALVRDPSPKSHLALGRFLTEVCRDNDALLPLERAAAEARTAGNLETAAKSLNLLSRIHHRGGRDREAARCEQAAIRVELDRAGCLSATTLVNLATTAAASRDLRRAGRLLQAADRIAAESESAFVHLARGLLYLSRGRERRAARSFRRAIRAARRTHALRDEAEARLRLAAVLCRRKQYRAAIRHGQKSAKLYARLAAHELQQHADRLVNAAAAARETQLAALARN